MTSSRLIDTIITREKTPEDLGAAFNECIAKAFEEEGVTPESLNGESLDSFLMKQIPEYPDYFAGAVVALGNACQRFGIMIHAKNSAFPVPNSDTLTPPCDFTDKTSPEEIIEFLKARVLPRLFDYLREAVKFCVQNKVDVSLTASLAHAFSAENLLINEWDLIVYLNFAFPKVPGR